MAPGADRWCKRCGDRVHWGLFCRECVMTFLAGVASALGAALAARLLR